MAIETTGVISEIEFEHLQGNTYLQQFLRTVFNELQLHCDKSISHISITIHGDKTYFSPSKEVRKLQYTNHEKQTVVEFQELKVPDVSMQHLVTVIANRITD